MTAEIKHLSRRGSRRTVTVSGLDRATVERLTRNPIRETEDGLEITLDNRSEYESLERAVQAANKPAHRPYSRRRIESLERAELYGLRHGKSWICREIDVETKGASPEWEGAAICYVYED